MCAGYTQQSIHPSTRKIDSKHNTASQRKRKLQRMVIVRSMYIK